MSQVQHKCFAHVGESCGTTSKLNNMPCPPVGPMALTAQCNQLACLYMDFPRQYAVDHHLSISYDVSGKRCTFRPFPEKSEKVHHFLHGDTHLIIADLGHLERPNHLKQLHGLNTFSPFCNRTLNHLQADLVSLKPVCARAWMVKSKAEEFAAVVPCLKSHASRSRCLFEGVTEDIMVSACMVGGRRMTQHTKTMRRCE